jgi:hypothetical protein
MLHPASLRQHPGMAAWAYPGWSRKKNGNYFFSFSFFLRKMEEYFLAP